MTKEARIYNGEKVSSPSGVGGRGKDGGVGGHGVHLYPQVHQEYLYKWNSSHRAPAEC